MDLVNDLQLIQEVNELLSDPTIWNFDSIFDLDILRQIYSVSSKIRKNLKLRKHAMKDKSLANSKTYLKFKCLEENTLYCFVLFAIFILHSRESELYRYTLDGKSALAWELPFSRFCGPPVFHIKMGHPVKCLAQGHNKQTCRLVLHNLP